MTTITVTDAKSHRAFTVEILTGNKRKQRELLELNRYELFESGFGKYTGWTFTVRGTQPRRDGDDEHVVGWKTFCRLLGFVPMAKCFSC